MKREKAIKLIDTHTVCFYNEIDSPTLQALHMAIEALQADAVDCTDFIEWLVDRVLDETIWENNSVAYGEIICRKLEKLGVLEATEEPSYYCLPLAESVVRCKDCRHRDLFSCPLADNDFQKDEDFCSWGERSEP